MRRFLFVICHVSLVIALLWPAAPVEGASFDYLNDVWQFLPSSLSQGMLVTRQGVSIPSPPNISSPAVGGGAVFTVAPSSGGNATLIAMDLDPIRDLDGNQNPDDGVPDRLVPGALFPQTDFLWTFDLTAGSVCTPILIHLPPGEDVVIVGDEAGWLYAREALTGQPFLAWTVNPVPLGGPIVGTPVLARGRLYVPVRYDPVSGFTGGVAVLDAATGRWITDPLPFVIQPSLIVGADAGASADDTYTSLSVGGPLGLIAFDTDRLSPGTFSEVFVMKENGTRHTNLTNNGAVVDQAPDWSPDGTKIAFVSFRDGNFEIYGMNADGTGQTNRTTNAAADLNPAWSPDGSKIAFFSFRDGNLEIYVMNADGTGQTRLTNNSTWDMWPDWSPDGTKIVFYSNREGNYEIYSMNADGTGQTNLTHNAALDRYPAWSPDGTRIAFQSDRADPNGDIYVMNADGTGQTRLTNNSAWDADPAWSPDGTKIAFQSSRDGNNEIYVMNASGTAQTRLTNTSANEGKPSWAALPLVEDALSGALDETLYVHGGDNRLRALAVIAQGERMTVDPTDPTRWFVRPSFRFHPARSTPATTLDTGVVIRINGGNSVLAPGALSGISVYPGSVWPTSFVQFPLGEDLNGNGSLDPGEDFNVNGLLDSVIDPAWVNVTVDYWTDPQANLKWVYNPVVGAPIPMAAPVAAANNLVVLTTGDEDLNNNGILDPGEDLNGNLILDFRADVHVVRDRGALPRNLGAVSPVVFSLVDPRDRWAYTYTVTYTVGSAALSGPAGTGSIVQTFSQPPAMVGLPPPDLPLGFGGLICLEARGDFSIKLGNPIAMRAAFPPPPVPTYAADPSMKSPPLHREWAIRLFDAYTGVLLDQVPFGGPEEFDDTGLPGVPGTYGNGRWDWTDTNANGVCDFTDTNLNGLWDPGETGEGERFVDTNGNQLRDPQFVQVDYGRGTIAPLNPDRLAGRLVLVQWADNTTDRRWSDLNGNGQRDAGETAAPIYYHEYHRFPSLIRWQYPSMSFNVTPAGVGLRRPAFSDANGNGIADVGEVVAWPLSILDGAGNWVQPLSVNFDEGIIDFSARNYAAAVTIGGYRDDTGALVSSSFTVTPTAGGGSFVDPPLGPFLSGVVIAGNAVLVEGVELDRSTGDSLRDVLLSFALDPRDTAYHDMGRVPWRWSPEVDGPAPPWAPGAADFQPPYPSFGYRDDGEGDPFLRNSGASANANYDLLGTTHVEDRGTGSVALAVSVPVVASGQSVAVETNLTHFGSMANAPFPVPLTVAVVTTMIHPVSGWRLGSFEASETLIADNNRLLGGNVNASHSAVVETPSAAETGILPVLSALEFVMPVSRASAARRLGYVGKLGNTLVADTVNSRVIELDSSGDVFWRLENRQLPNSVAGALGGFAAFYDTPGLPDFMDLPQDAPRTVVHPTDAYRWEIVGPDPRGLLLGTVNNMVTFVADSGNSRILEILTTIPLEPLEGPPPMGETFIDLDGNGLWDLIDTNGNGLWDPGEDEPLTDLNGNGLWDGEAENELLWASDFRPLVIDATDPTSQQLALKQGGGYEYISARPLRDHTDPPLYNTPFNFSGVIAGLNGAALNTVASDDEDLNGNGVLDLGEDLNGNGVLDDFRDPVAPPRGPLTDYPAPLPREFGPGASVVKVGRHIPGSPLDGVSSSIEWAFSRIYWWDQAGAVLRPFKNLTHINYVDVRLEERFNPQPGTPGAETAQSAYYLVIADDEGVYPVTYFPAVGPEADPDPAAWPVGAAPRGYAILALPPNLRLPNAGLDLTTGLGPPFALEMLLKHPLVPGVVTYANVMRAMRNAGAPVEYAGTAPPADAVDAPYGYFQPTHVELQPNNLLLVTNGHERKSEVLEIDPYRSVVAGLLAQILPEPRAYIGEDLNGNGILDPGEDLNGNNVLDIPNLAGIFIGTATYGLMQPGAVSRKPGR